MGSCLDALEAGLEKYCSGLPRLSRRVGTIAPYELFIAECMGNILAGPDFDTFLVLGRRRTKPVYILTGHPLVKTGLVIEYRAEQVVDRGFRLHHSSVIHDRCSKPFPLTGEPERIRSTHAETDHAVDILFNVVARIQEFTAGIDVLQDERLVQLAHQRIRNLCVGRHHATQSSVQVRNDDAVAFARQLGAEILDLRGQSPGFMQ